MNAPVIQRIIAHRRGILTDDATRLCRAGYCVDTLISRALDTPDAERVLVNFVDGFIRHSAAA